MMEYIIIDIIKIKKEKKKKDYKFNCNTKIDRFQILIRIQVTDY